MLPRYRKLLIFAGAVVLSIAAIFVVSRISNASHCEPAFEDNITIDKPDECNTLSGNQTIRVFSQLTTVDHINIRLMADTESSSPPANCPYIIKTGLKPVNPTQLPLKFEMTWDTTTVVDFHRYWLLVEAYADPDETLWVGSAHQPNSVNNGLSGEPCDEPEEPSGEEPPTSENGSSEETESESSQSTSQTTTEQTTSTEQITQEESDEKIEEDEEGEVEENIIEEIPITIDSFDPDIFLKGGDVRLDDVKNSVKNDQSVLKFQGTAAPNKLVTLYIFSETIVVVVKSDEAGNWVYNLKKPLSTGKHMAFATVNDDNVTRRSNVAEFFIAKSTSEGRSLLLEKSNFQRLYPYAGALGVAVFLAVSIVAMYRIYNKRKVVKV